jgi:hypothetical protein
MAAYHLHGSPHITILRMCPAFLFPAEDVLAEVRREFELQKSKAALYDIKYALSDGRTRLRFLEEAIGFSR